LAEAPVTRYTKVGWAGCVLSVAATVLVAAAWGKSERPRRRNRRRRR